MKHLASVRVIMAEQVAEEQVSTPNMHVVLQFRLDQFRCLQCSLVMWRALWVSVFSAMDCASGISICETGADPRSVLLSTQLQGGIFGTTAIERLPGSPFAASGSKAWMRISGTIQVEQTCVMALQAAEHIGQSIGIAVCTTRFGCKNPSAVQVSKGLRCSYRVRTRSCQDKTRQQLQSKADTVQVKKLRQVCTLCF